MTPSTQQIEEGIERLRESGYRNNSPKTLNKILEKLNTKLARAISEWTSRGCDEKSGKEVEKIGAIKTTIIMVLTHKYKQD